MDFEGRRFTVLEMERNRIARVRVEKIVPATGARDGVELAEPCKRWRHYVRHQPPRRELHLHRGHGSAAAVPGLSGSLHALVFRSALLFAYLLSPLVNLLDRFLPGRTRTPALALAYVIFIGLARFSGHSDRRDRRGAGHGPDEEIPRHAGQLAAADAGRNAGGQLSQRRFGGQSCERKWRSDPTIWFRSCRSSA